MLEDNVSGGAESDTGSSLENELNDWLAQRFYAQVILTVIDHARLLESPRLAQQVTLAVESCRPETPGRLWGYAVLPDNIRLVVGPADENSLEAFVDRVKERTSARLLAVILRADDDSLDAVLRYNPVWGGAIYQVWQAGSHRAVYWTEYKLSNALYELQQAARDAAGPAAWTEGNATT